MTFTRTLNIISSASTNLPIEGDIRRFPPSLGDFNSSGDTYFESIQDGDMVMLTFDNFTINEGHLVTVSHRCKGLALNILGDCIINGQLSMTARGANAEGQNIIFDPIRRSIIFDVEDISNHPWSIPAYGLVKPVKNGSGIAGINGLPGSGGSGRNNTSSNAGLGAVATSFSGGSGGGGESSAATGTNRIAGQDAFPNGGAGGKGANNNGSSSGGGGGGAGNPGGERGTGTARNGFVGADGTGGLICLIVSGNLTIGSAGIIYSDGSSGGDGAPWVHNVSNGGSGGGGSGGGSINIFYKGLLSNLGTVRANGGAGGAHNHSGNHVGFPGGVGSIRIINY